MPSVHTAQCSGTSENKQVLTASPTGWRRNSLPHCAVAQDLRLRQCWLLNEKPQLMTYFKTACGPTTCSSFSQILSHPVHYLLLGLPTQGMDQQQKNYSISFPPRRFYHLSFDQILMVSWPFMECSCSTLYVIYR